MADRFDLVYVRKQFPALRRTVSGRPAAYLDSPGGTQTPQCVLDAITRYLVDTNANVHGQFVTSEESDRLLEQAHAAVADLLGCSAQEVVFGANMTTLSLLLAQTIMRDLRPGDEIVITELDHEANRGPWLHLAERGVVVREAPVDPATCTLDYDALEALIGERTKVVAVGYASNAVGTVNDVARVVRAAKQVDALTVVDAVHWALHGPIDVRALDCDFLLCSMYKVFGPHVGVMYGRRRVLERLRPLKLVTQEDELPFRFETGTLNHEGMAGTIAAIEFIADLGRRHGGAGPIGGELWLRRGGDHQRALRLVPLGRWRPSVPCVERRSGEGRHRPDGAAGRHGLGRRGADTDRLLHALRAAAAATSLSASPRPSRLRRCPPRRACPSPCW